MYSPNFSLRKQSPGISLDPNEMSLLLTQCGASRRLLCDSLFIRGHCGCGFTPFCDEGLSETGKQIFKKWSKTYCDVSFIFSLLEREATSADYSWVKIRPAGAMYVSRGSRNEVSPRILLENIRVRQGRDPRSRGRLTN